MSFATPERARQYNRQYYSTHAEAIRKKANSYNQKHREERLEYQRKYQLRSAHKRQQKKWIKFLLKGLIYEDSRFKICRHCGEEFEKPTHGPKLFCSYICANNHRADRYAKRNGTYDLRICRNCGNHFKKIHGPNAIKTFCSQLCKKAHRRKLRNIYARENRKRNPMRYIYWKNTNGEKLRIKWQRANSNRSEAMATLDNLIGRDARLKLKIYKNDSTSVLKKLLMEQ
jgi:hypothetical protein